MAVTSAGIVLYKAAADDLWVLLVHPGGPFWHRKDEGAWSIPKGEVEAGEDLAAAARREFAEELGVPPPGPLEPLGAVRQAGGKWVEAFAAAGDLDPAAITSDHFEIEWPPRSGRLRAFPEVDRAAWFALSVARQKILAAQRPFLDRLESLLTDRNRQA
ncbi:NUDIX domain-containing protein [uncultured Methylovirgula sp.]|uniref:NUDIX domain-containing protein n=1 Tax=uncultured Methylovirgula sp. TaxID=1285960 RepID=UPI0026252C6B|nr:NUDIX domain-containing protein [uncultured Methylovirgula sp.]